MFRKINFLRCSQASRETKKFVMRIITPCFHSKPLYSFFLSKIYYLSPAYVLSNRKLCKWTLFHVIFSRNKRGNFLLTNNPLHSPYLTSTHTQTHKFYFLLFKPFLSLPFYSSKNFKWNIQKINAILWIDLILSADATTPSFTKRFLMIIT